jgi:hypothetical protein
MIPLVDVDEQRLYSCSVALRFGESASRVEAALTDIRTVIMLDYAGDVFMERPAVLEALLYTLTVI